MFVNWRKRITGRGLVDEFLPPLKGQFE